MNQLLYDNEVHSLFIKSIGGGQWRSLSKVNYKQEGHEVPKGHPDCL